MRKFKIFFYPIYIIIALVILYFSVDMLTNLDAYKAKMTFGDLQKAPVYVLSLVVFMVVLMLAELIVENSHIMSLKRKVAKAEKEVLQLKAKLYDRSQDESAPELSQEQEEEDDLPVD